MRAGPSSTIVRTTSSWHRPAPAVERVAHVQLERILLARHRRDAALGVVGVRLGAVLLGDDRPRARAARPSARRTARQCRCREPGNQIVSSSDQFNTPGAVCPMPCCGVPAIPILATLWCLVDTKRRTADIMNCWRCSERRVAEASTDWRFLLVLEGSLAGRAPCTARLLGFTARRRHRRSTPARCGRTPYHAYEARWQREPALREQDGAIEPDGGIGVDRFGEHAGVGRGENGGGGRQGAPARQITRDLHFEWKIGRIV